MYIEIQSEERYVNFIYHSFMMNKNLSENYA